MKVAIFFGSKSDTDVMKGAANALKEFGVDYKAYILSAHRVPEKLAETIEKIEKDGCEVIIAGAGLAAHLPGVIASQTTLPVIGVPVKAAVEGMDALLSIVQMPGGVPVAATAIGKAGATNAGLLAAQMLSMYDKNIALRLEKKRQQMTETVLESSEQLG